MQKVKRFIKLLLLKTESLRKFSISNTFISAQSRIRKPVSCIAVKLAGTVNFFMWRDAVLLLYIKVSNSEPVFLDETRKAFSCV